MGPSQEGSGPLDHMEFGQRRPSRGMELSQVIGGGMQWDPRNTWHY
jgi:hypothetical protein